MAFDDILYEKRDGIATITINRPKVLNAFRGETVEEMLAAMRDAEGDAEIGVIVLAGAGGRAFCAGGDNSARGSRAEREGGYGGARCRLRAHGWYARPVPLPHQAEPCPS